MATFTAFFHGFFSPTFVSITGTEYTLTDSDADTDFQLNEAITGVTPLLANGNFVGTFEHSGNTYIVLDTGGGFFDVYSTVDPAFTTYPVGFPLPTLNTSDFTTCFAKGTLICTSKGEFPVEDIKIGDLLCTANGGLKPAKWIGRQTVVTLFGPAERLMPVCISAGALGGNLPHSDLTVTADHGMLVDGVICHASALVNGTTITRVPLADMGETYTVYHIETENHEIILANGAPAETFIDNVSRKVFDNYAEFEALYGDVPEMEELPYPRAMSARQVPEIIMNTLSADLNAA